MRKTPSMFLILLVVGVPSLLVLGKLWPTLQDRLSVHSPDDVSIPLVAEQDASQVDDPATAFKQAQTIAPVPTSIGPTTSANQLSPVDKVVAANRERLDAAKASYDRVFQATDSELLRTFGMGKWREIETLVSQAQQLPQPLIAAEKYREAETQLRELRADLPTRKLLAELTELQSLQQEQLRFLVRLSEAGNSQPEIQERLAPFWTEVSNWDSQNWLSLVRRESEDLSPDDGGFADVYHALADYQREFGSPEAAADADQVAWENALRMTNPIRAAQSAIRALKRLPTSTPASTRATRIEETNLLVRDVLNAYERMEFLADLATLQSASESRSLLDEIQTVATSSRIDLRNYWPLIYRCKVLAETRPPSEIFDVCVALPKYNANGGLESFSANTMGYAHAATAAARTNQQAAFWRAMLLAEAQQLDSTGIDVGDQRACSVLASADLRRRNFRRVVISAMNLRENALRPQLLFPAMLDSASDVPTQAVIPLIQSYGTNDRGCTAVAHYMPTLIRHFESEADAISWMLKLKAKSVRIAAMIGFARHRKAPQRLAQPNPIPTTAIDTTNPRSLLENAEESASLVQMPFDRAWAYLWIAACWNKLGQPASYANALTKSDDAIFSVWKSHWNSSEGNTETSSYRYDKQQDRDLEEIIDFYATLAEVQAFILKDSHRAVENIITAARASQPLNHGNGNLKIRLWLVCEAIHGDCDLPPGTLDSVFLPPNDYYRMLLIAAKRDLSSLTSSVQGIETKGIGNGFQAPDFIARAHAELAMLSAKNGAVNGYRSARRKAAGLISSKGAVDSLLLPLHEADAYAGEFALAMNEKRHLGPLPLYGTSGRTQAALCRQLSLASRTQDAISRLPSISEPFWRLQAMHAVAASRCNTTPSDELVRWQSEQNEQLDRIAVLCGLACKQPIP